METETINKEEVGQEKLNDLGMYIYNKIFSYLTFDDNKEVYEKWLYCCIYGDTSLNRAVKNTTCLLFNKELVNDIIKLQKIAEEQNYTKKEDVLKINYHFYDNFSIKSIDIELINTKILSLERFNYTKLETLKKEEITEFITLQNSIFVKAQIYFNEYKKQYDDEKAARQLKLKQEQEQQEKQQEKAKQEQVLKEKTEIIDNLRQFVKQEMIKELKLIPATQKQIDADTTRLEDDDLINFLEEHFSEQLLMLLDISKMKYEIHTYDDQDEKETYLFYLNDGWFIY